MECLLCKDKSQRTIPLCLPCENDLPWHPSEHIAFYYQPPIDHWITLLKFHDQLQFAHLFGHLWVHKLQKRKHYPQLIMPIPLHTFRLIQRGFNQALEITKPISRHCKIPIDRKTLKRIRHTKPQSKLTERDRLFNLIDAFECAHQIDCDHIALFDDVMTTGSTLNAAHEALKKSGVKNIELWCCAKT